MATKKQAKKTAKKEVNAKKKPVKKEATRKTAPAPDKIDFPIVGKRRRSSMTRKDKRPEDDAKLRRPAETIARKEAARSLENLDALSIEEIQGIVHELRVHQIELSMQNEELRQAQQDIAMARNRYSDLFNQAPVGYCILNEQGLIQEANFTVHTLLGMARGVLIRQPMTRFIFKEDQDIYYLHRRQLEPGSPRMCEVRMVKNTGTQFMAHLTTTMAQDVDGAPVSRVVINDITEQLRHREEKAGLEAQLHQAQKMESIGRLAGGVAHDFNNMLSIIIGYAQLGKDDAAPGDPIQTDLDEILQAGKRSMHLVRQLLAFARKQIIEPRVLDLNELIWESEKMLGRLVGEEIEIRFSPGDDLWNVRIDPSQMDQVLVNLSVNARDAITGVGTFTIETENVELDQAYCDAHAGFKPGQYVLLSFSDSGKGMGKEILEKIFEPFFTTKGGEKGTGLGLSTVYGIMKQNDGFINVYSEPGQGTTFKLYLPRHRGQVEEMKKRDAANPVLEGTETILVVEDEEKVLTLAELILKKHGYKVLTATLPEKALSLCEKHTGHIHLLITDVVLPEMDGGQLAQRVTKLKPGIKTLYMSGYTANVIAQKGVLYEGVQFIQKPFSHEALLEKVRKVLDGQ